MIFRWIYLPPLLIYLSAGVSGLTGIVGIFFLKDYLNLSAAFIRPRFPSLIKSVNGKP